MTSILCGEILINFFKFFFKHCISGDRVKHEEKLPKQETSEDNINKIKMENTETPNNNSQEKIKTENKDETSAGDKTGGGAKTYLAYSTVPKCGAPPDGTSWQVSSLVSCRFPSLLGHTLIKKLVEVSH